MSAGANTLGAFVLRTFLWLPPCFAVWYFTAKYHAAVAGWLAHATVNQFMPGLVTALEQTGIDLTFVTTIQVHPQPGQTALLLPEVNPLLYSYGLAFFLALMLGARATWWKILAGIALLVPFQSWGIAFDFLAQVGVNLGPEVAAQAGLAGWRREAIALGYQIGTLILPSFMPVVLWAVSSPRFVEGMLRTSANPSGAGSQSQAHIAS